MFDVVYWMSSILSKVYGLALEIMVLILLEMREGSDEPMLGSRERGAGVLTP